MAEVYTVTVNKTTPVEVTGGRVGQFVFVRESFFFGGITVANTGANGITYGSSENISLYVTSPDEIYAILDVGAGPPTKLLTVYHNR